MKRSGFQIAPLRALRFAVPGSASGRAEDLVAPPYDIISPEEHGRLLERSAHNIVRLTLGETPGEKEDYRVRGARLLDWQKRDILRVDPEPALYVYGCDYTVPGTSTRASFRGLVALGRLHALQERVVLPHERTFPEHVDDRFHLLEATRTQLEPIFLLYEDAHGRIDTILDEQSAGEADFAVEAKPGEVHSLWMVCDASATKAFGELFGQQRPIMADGHHRYTTALQYREHVKDDTARRPGSEWQPMVFGNLVGDGLSILATHRLVDCRGRADEALEILRERLEPAGDNAADWDYRIDTRSDTLGFRIPAGIREASKGVAASDYAILRDVVIGEWLGPVLAPDGELGVQFFKEGSGEREALERGDGDLLFQMKPVSPGEFRSVVDGGEVFPQKTTFFYPKLWSGLVLWALEDATGL